MPIKPENRALYPSNWREIRASILERAGNLCEVCGVENHAWGHRDEEGRFIPRPPRGDMHGKRPKQIRIVLTISHLNHDPTDNRPENLKAMCQRCHLRHDAEHHARNAAMTRRARKQASGQPALLEAQP